VLSLNYKQGFKEKITGGRRKGLQAKNHDASFAQVVEKF
jgi:hypothetical protein